MYRRRFGVPFAIPGRYDGRVKGWAGHIAVVGLLGLALPASGVTRYVAVSGGNVSPYTSWASAATSIQLAVSACVSGDVVVVTNGTYRGPVNIGVPITVTSLNGSAVTTVSGGLPLYTNRCFYITNSLAVVDGFTLKDGRAPSADGGAVYLRYGGTIRNCVIVSNNAGLGGAGVICRAGGLVQNCLIADNRGDDFGGGVFCSDGGTVDGCTILRNGVHGGAGGGVALVGGGLLKNSVIVSNDAHMIGGGVYCSVSGVVQDCVIAQNSASNYGGGVYGEDCTIARCTISNNWTYAAWPEGKGGGVLMTRTGLIENCNICNNWGSDRGGGIVLDTNCEARSCMIQNNKSQYYAGGVYVDQGARLCNCTVVHNSTMAIGSSGGGVHCYYGGRLANTIVYFNNAADLATSNYWDEGGLATFSNCCSSPMPVGTANIGADPQFVAASLDKFHLKSGSPCIDAGTNAGWMLTATDIDGQERVFNHRVDIGADEATVHALPPFGGRVFTSWWSVVVGSTCKLQHATSMADDAIWSDAPSVVTAASETISFVATNAAENARFERLIWVQ